MQPRSLGRKARTGKVEGGFLARAQFPLHPEAHIAGSDLTA